MSECTKELAIVDLQRTQAIAAALKPIVEKAQMIAGIRTPIRHYLEGNPLLRPAREIRRST